MEFSWHVLLVSLLGGLAIALGAVIVILMRKISDRFFSLILGFAAGIMLAMSTFDLLPEAIEHGSVLICGIGLVGGIVFMLLIDRFLSHGRSLAVLDTGNSYLRMGLFIAAGIAMHNLPEGLALGAGYEVAPTLGVLMAVAVGLHNVPEGISIAAPLKRGGLKPLWIFLIAAAVGLFTVLGTLISFLFVSMSGNVLAIAMGFSAGSMLYIVADELLPEGHARQPLATNIGFSLGFLMMLIISFV